MAWNDFSKEELRLILTTTHDLCAMHDLEPKCSDYRLVRGDQFYGEFAHICGSRPGGDRRYEEAMTKADRQSIDNIIILCPNHHTIIDKKGNGYSADALREIKRRHTNDTSHSNPDITDSAIEDAMMVANSTVENHNNNIGNGVQQVSSMNGTEPQTSISIAGDYYALVIPDPASPAFPLEVTQLAQISYSTQIVRLKTEWLDVPAISGAPRDNSDNEYYFFQVGEKQFVIKKQDFASHLSGMRTNRIMGTLIMNAGEIRDLLLQIRLLTAEGIQEHNLIDEIRILSAEKPLRIAIATDDSYVRSVPFAILDAETAQCTNPIKLMFGGGSL
jgi:hypothetical protein